MAWDSSGGRPPSFLSGDISVLQLKSSWRVWAVWAVWGPGRDQAAWGTQQPQDSSAGSTCQAGGDPVPSRVGPGRAAMWKCSSFSCICNKDTRAFSSRGLSVPSVHKILINLFLDNIYSFRLIGLGRGWFDGKNGQCLYPGAGRAFWRTCCTSALLWEVDALELLEKCAS